MVATTNIPGLPPALSLIGTEESWAVQAGVDVRINLNQLAQFIISVLTNSSTLPLFLPSVPVSITASTATVTTNMAHIRGIVKNGTGDTTVTWAAGLTVGTFIPWVRQGSGNLIFTAGGAGTNLVEMTGYDRAWQQNSSGFAWCISNTDGNTPIVVMSGDMAAP